MLGVDWVLVKVPTAQESSINVFSRGGYGVLLDGNGVRL